MNPKEYQDKKCHILYDSDAIGQVESDWFLPETWQARHAVVGQAQGRGTTWYVQQDQQQWVLRQYRRGGWVANLTTDHYVWQGLAQTRAWQEWHLLAELHAKGLPVPAPIAAHVCQQGLFYTAQIITTRIPEVHSLSTLLQQKRLPSAVWQRLGATLKRFHQQGVYHADLNAHNILLGANYSAYLIDFDKGSIRDPGVWRLANILRLKRSLRKLARTQSPFYFNELEWATLLEGYANA